MYWEGNMLIDNKGYIYAGVFRQNGEYKIIVWRNGYFVDFDGFATTEEAKEYAEKAVGK